MSHFYKKPYLRFAFTLGFVLSAAGGRWCRHRACSSTRWWVFLPEQSTVTFACPWSAQSEHKVCSPNNISLISWYMWYFHSNCPFCDTQLSIAKWFSTAVFLPISRSWKHLHCCSKLWCQVGPFSGKLPTGCHMFYISSSNNSGLGWIMRRIQQGTDSYYGYGSCEKEKKKANKKWKKTQDNVTAYDEYDSLRQ